MKAEHITVISHSGYRGEESPRAFIFRSEQVEVMKILDTSLQEDRGTRRRRRFFTVRGGDRRIYTLYYDEECEEWFLIM